MTRFKYDVITEDELNTFYNGVSLWIHNILHKGTWIIPHEDLYQEVWNHIVRKRHTWNEKLDTAVTTWLYKMVWNKAKKMNSKELKRRGIWHRIVQSMETDAIPYEDHNAYRLDLLEKVIPKLNDDQKKFVNMFINPNINIVGKYNRLKQRPRTSLNPSEVVNELGWTSSQVKQCVMAIRKTFEEVENEEDIF